MCNEISVNYLSQTLTIVDHTSDDQLTPVLTSLADADECQEPDKTGCDPKATCQNIPGAYFCQCKTGYTGDGTRCEGTISL